MAHARVETGIKLKSRDMVRREVRHETAPQTAFFRILFAHPVDLVVGCLPGLDPTV
jgi:hypothetical protein